MAFFFRYKFFLFLVVPLFAAYVDGMMTVTDSCVFGDAYGSCGSKVAMSPDIALQC